MNLHDLESEISVWQSMHWPDGVDVHRCMTKITEELGELGRALIRGEDEEVVESEAADVIITVIAAMVGMGCSAADGLDAKWPVVRDRDPRARHVPEKS